ncbi:MAG TPA: aldose 1-epimerase [Chitinophagales bacterium]|nr:aldose 1-epimerase [Chitinophagales bacterium]
MKHTSHHQSQDNFEVVILQNDSITAEIAVNIGNSMFSLKHNENEILHFPHTLQEYKYNTQLAGNPFMHPWANRLEGAYILVNKERYYFPKEQQNLLYRDGNALPLHGLLLKSDKWNTVEMGADDGKCWHVASHDFGEEKLLSIFPFLHKIFIKHQLQNNMLTIETTIKNIDTKAMPISFGFHPYFKRNAKNATLHLPSEQTLLTDAQQIPNGKTISKEERWKFENDEIDLCDTLLDDGFTALERKEENAIFKLNNIRLLFDKQYSFAQVYAPQYPEKPYVCIEPMTAPTNALNTGGCTLLPAQAEYTAGFSIVLN